MLALLAGLFVSYLLGAIYSLWINPEIRFWKQAYKQKIEWADKLSANGRPKLVFIGGSSTAFQIDAELLTAAGIPTVNMGMHAGMGTRANAAFGLSAAKPGDTVIWAFEKGRMASYPEITDLGYQALLSTGLIFGSGLEKLPLGRISWQEAFKSLRPGLAHTASMIAKLVSGGSLYRYQTRLIRPGGSITTDERRPVSRAELNQLHPDHGTLGWIAAMCAALALQKSPSAYLLPHEYYLLSDKETGMDQNRKFLEELSLTMNVVNDPFMGVQTDERSFADTVSHLTEKARLERTRGLIPLLKPFTRTEK
jgi:hypothetical protein